jgi:hypothetical protein
VAEAALRIESRKDLEREKQMSDLKDQLSGMCVNTQVCM